MPIRPERKHLYPTNWKTEIVPMIRQRSGDCCERCGVMNGYWIRRELNGMHYTYSNIDGEIAKTGLIDLWYAEVGLRLPNYPVKGIANTFEWNPAIRIILTVANLNHDETDNRPENLAHLCQLHHNRHDAKHRAETRRRH